MALAQNPILRGFNPDPSVCRVGEDYYIVTSTFEYFPGVPIYHSRDLAHWSLIGHALTRPDQLPLEGCRGSQGIFAPVLRHHDGMFYMITTNVSGGGNFIVHARDPRGPWSDPVWIDQRGIDPSLTFDGEDCYLLTSHSEVTPQEILMSRIEPLTGRLLCAPRAVNYGTGGIYPEAPHLYHIGRWYYLLLAEGGTSYNHSVTIQRSGSPWGPFEPCPHNPILTQVGSKGLHSPFQCAGHADLVEDALGGWWMVCLAVRTLPGVDLHNLGRETFLSRLVWDGDGWPGINDNGTLCAAVETGLPEAVGDPTGFEDDFSRPDFSPRWTWLRDPAMSDYRRGGGRLCLAGHGVRLSDGGCSPTFMGIRQPEPAASVSACVRLEGDGSAGLTAYYDEEHHYDLALERRSGRTCVVVRKRLYDNEFAVARMETDAKEVDLAIRAAGEAYHFLARPSGGGWIRLASGAAAGLCTETTRWMTFTGTFLGLFCEEGSARFERFRLAAGPEERSFVDPA